MTNYKKLFFEEGYSDEDWHNVLRYKKGARDEIAKAAVRLYSKISNPINNPINSPINSPKRITFKGGRYSGKVNPSSEDVCDVCGMTHDESRKKYGCRLHWHHDEYISPNQTTGVRWLCKSCHRKFHAQFAKKEKEVIENEEHIDQQM